MNQKVSSMEIIPDSIYPIEQELLLRRGAIFRIIKAWEEEGIKRLKMEISYE